MGFDKQNKPLYAHFDHRIISHELESDLPTSYLKIVSDPVSERRNDWSRQKYEESDAAKFDLEGLYVNGGRSKPGHERPIFYSYLDRLMEQIPGKDNYGASIKVNGFDAKIMSASPLKRGKDLNGAYYHRPYKLRSKDAMGVDTAQRSYSDRVYVAMTNQTKVAGPTYLNVDKKGVVLKSVHVQASYAVPVEILYITPLSKWNPFAIKYESDCKNIEGNGTKVFPFNATCPGLHYLTPDSFYTGGSLNSCSDSDGVTYFKSPYFVPPVCLRPSGIHIVLPDINGIDGIIRQRYPIMPINGEGSSVWKKLNALEDSVNLSGAVVPKSA